MMTSPLWFALALAAGGRTPSAAGMVPLGSPNAAVAEALADVQSLPNDGSRASIRYLSLYAIGTAAERDDWRRLGDFALNSLNSVSGILVQAAPVDPQAGLLRIDLRQLHIDPDAWDSLGLHGSGPAVSAAKIDLPEPYWHRVIHTSAHTATVQRVHCAPYVAADGKAYDYRDQVIPARAAHQSLIAGEWIDPAAFAALQAETYTWFPIFRIDWFVTNALITPAYSRFLGLKTLADLERIARLHRQEDADLEAKGVVAMSGGDPADGVASNIRATIFQRTSLGLWTQTLDFLASVGDRDLLSNPLDETKADAGEIIATMRNGLPVWGLINGQKQIIDVADPNIATNQRTAWRNHGVWTSVSCIGCHSEACLKDVLDDVRPLMGPKSSALVRDHDGAAEQFAEQFGAPLSDELTAGRAIYARAVRQATGWAPAKLSQMLESRFVAYIQDPIWLDQAARDVGSTPEAVQAWFAAHRPVGLDHTLTSLLAGYGVRPDQWVNGEGMHQLMVFMGTGQ